MSTGKVNLVSKLLACKIERIFQRNTLRERSFFENPFLKSTNRTFHFVGKCLHLSKRGIYGKLVKSWTEKCRLSRLRLLSETQRSVRILFTVLFLTGDDLVINGQKMWITNSLQADWMCLLANTREGAPHVNKSLIIVPMDTPGTH